MSEGSEFQVVAAATEKARRARSFLVPGAISSGASDRNSRLDQVAQFYACVEDDHTLNVSDAIL